MRTNKLLIILMLTAFATALTGCSAEPEQNRSVVSVSSLNLNATPVFSDVVTNASVFEDVIVVEFSNRPYNNLVITGEDRPYYEFLITGYRVEYTRTDGGAVPAPFQDAMSASVVSTKSTMASVTVVTALSKTVPPLSTLVSGGGEGEIRLMANYTFTGREVGTDRNQEFKASIQVAAADWADTP